MIESTSSNRFRDLTTGIPAPRLDSIPEAFRPFVEIGMELQSEVLQLCGGRVRAWLDWPGQCISCKNVDDLSTAQRNYFVQMQKDYAHFMDAVLQDTLIEQDEYREDGNRISVTHLHQEAA